MSLYFGAPKELKLEVAVALVVRNKSIGPQMADALNDIVELKARYEQSTKSLCTRIDW